MGASVSKQLDWVDTSDNNLSKEGLPLLPTSAANQGSLYDMLRKIEQLTASYPAESKSEFRKPLQWTTGLVPSTFASHSTSANWIVKEASKYYHLMNRSHKASVTSSALKSDGQPWFSLEALANGQGFQAKVWSFDYLNRVLGIASENKLKELQAIINGNFL